VDLAPAVDLALGMPRVLVDTRLQPASNAFFSQKAFIRR
jgi:hypothetical protein